MKSKKLWRKKSPGQTMGQSFYIPPNEAPICCPEKKKNPVPTPVDRFDPRYAGGTLTCEPKDGGCGSTWTPDKP